MDTVADDIIRGANKIAKFLGENPRRILYLHERKAIPTFRMGAAVCARKSTLLDWISKQESKMLDGES